MRFSSLGFQYESYRLNRVRIHHALVEPVDGIRDQDDAVLVDVIVRGGRFAAFLPSETTPDSALPTIDMEGRHIWPGLVDAHVHLDKCHSVPRLSGANGTFAGARDATNTDRETYWTRDDIYRRMSFGLSAAYAHGVFATRTHLDSPEPQAETTWSVFRQLREEWRGKVELQAAGLVPIDVYGTPFGAKLAALVARSGGVMGGVTRPTSGLHGMPLENFDQLIQTIFDLARQYDLDIDLHVDETNDIEARALRRVAEATIRNGYEGRVTCGHCCSLALQPADEAAETIDIVARAGVSVITLPLVNMYLQDRLPGRTPRWRGVPPVAELRGAGVRVAVAGDNCRDAFYAYGDHDVFDTFRQAVRILHLDNPVADAPALVTAAPAAIMRLRDHGVLRTGQSADFIAFNARSLNELLSRPHQDRKLVRNGRLIVPEAPDYSELDTPLPTQFSQTPLMETAI